MTNTRKGRCVLCGHELLLCGDCASQICPRPRCRNAVCECDTERIEARSHYRFQFKDAAPEALAKALLRPVPQGAAADRTRERGPSSSGPAKGPAQ